MNAALPPLIFAACAALCFLAGFPVARLLGRLQVLDRPNPRSSHAQPTLRGGGLAIVLAVLAAGLALLPQGRGGPLGGLLLGGLMISAVSFCDDLRSLPAALRLGCHAAAALLALAALGWPALPGGGAGALAHAAGAAVLFLWIVGYTNAFNFMDGINGLAAVQTVIAGLGMAALAWTSSSGSDGTAVLFCLALAGAAAGFLPHNFPRARMFMGDVSSASLGYLLAALVCWLGLADGGRLLLPLLLLHANFILDTAITLVRRWWRGEKLFQSHQEHFYQRLIRAGHSHARVTLGEGALQAIAAAALVVASSRGAAATAWTGLGVVAMWTLFFLGCEKIYRDTAKRSARAMRRG